MPFKSEKQRAYLYANEPQIAKKWAAEHGNKISKKNTGGIMITPKGFNLMMANKRQKTKIV